jgi:hypothetical protein
MPGRTQNEFSNHWKMRLLPNPAFIPNLLHILIGVHKPVGNGRERSGPVSTDPYRRSHNPKAAG